MNKLMSDKWVLIMFLWSKNIYAQLLKAALRFHHAAPAKCI